MSDTLWRNVTRCILQFIKPDQPQPRISVDWHFSFAHFIKQLVGNEKLVNCKAYKSALNIKQIQKKYTRLEATLFAEQGCCRFGLLLQKKTTPSTFYHCETKRLIVLHVGQFLLPLSLAFWATKRSNNRSAVAIRATERRSLRLASLLRNRSGSNDGHTLTLNRARNAAFRQEYSRN